MNGAQRVWNSIAKNVRKNGGSRYELLAKRHTDKLIKEDNGSKVYQFHDESTLVTSRDTTEGETAIFPIN